MYRLFQINYVVIVGFILMSSIPVANSASMIKEVSNSIKSLEISMVNFYMTSIVNVRCDEFEKIFGEEINTVFVYDKADIARFDKVLKKLAPSLAECPDTRARVLIHYQNGHVDTLCVAHTSISLNGEVMNPSKEMVEFIEKIAAVSRPSVQR